MLGILKRSPLRTMLIPRCQACGHAVDAPGEGKVNPIRGSIITSPPMAEVKTVLIVGCKACCGDTWV